MIMDIRLRVSMEFDPDIGQHVQGVCPPAGAMPADGVFYRHVMSYPCTDADFESDIKANKKPARQIEKCDSWGCSLCDSVEAMEALKERVSLFRKKGLFVKVKLQPNHGVVDDNTGHRSFWKCIGASIAIHCEAI